MEVKRSGGSYSATARASVWRPRRLGFAAVADFRGRPAGPEHGLVALYALRSGLRERPGRGALRSDTRASQESSYAGTLYYKLNNWVTFAFERYLYETDAVPGLAGALPLLRVIPSRTRRDLRSKGGTIDGRAFALCDLSPITRAPSMREIGCLALGNGSDFLKPTPSV